jgi:hypothetical protein
LELEVGQSLTDEISKALRVSRFIAILITENYNKTVWTKNEYKIALDREQTEQRTVMLPLIVGEAQIPDFLQGKIYIGLRTEYFAGITKLVGMIHRLTPHRISEALRHQLPQTVSDVWRLLLSIGFEPYVILGKDDFDEMVSHGSTLLRPDYVEFNPFALLGSETVSDHVKALVRELLTSKLGELLYEPKDRLLRKPWGPRTLDSC